MQQTSANEDLHTRQATTIGLRPGQSIGRMTVMEATPTSVLLSRANDPLGLGWVRFALAAASLGAGIACWSACLSGTLGGLKVALVAWVLMALFPIWLALPYNIMCGASLRAADGSPGLVFERGKLFFFRSYDLIQSHEIVEFQVGASQRYCSLRVIRRERRDRIIVRDTATQENIAVMRALREAIAVAVGIAPME